MHVHAKCIGEQTKNTTNLLVFFFFLHFVNALKCIVEYRANFEAECMPRKEEETKSYIIVWRHCFIVASHIYFTVLCDFVFFFLLPLRIWLVFSPTHWPCVLMTKNDESAAEREQNTTFRLACMRPAERSRRRGHIPKWRWHNTMHFYGIVRHKLLALKTVEISIFDICSLLAAI